MKLKLLKEAHEVSEYISIEKTIEKFGYDPRYLSLHSHKQVICICNSCNKIIELCFRAANKHKYLDCKGCVHINKEYRKKCSIGKKKYFETHSSTFKGKHHSEEAKKKLSLINKDKHKGEKNSFYGKHHSIESKIKIVSGRKIPYISGPGSPMYGKHHTKESKQQISINNKGKLAGKNSHFYGKKPYNSKGEWFTKEDGTKIWMRSSWEIKIAKELEYWNVKFDYEPKAFPVTYLYEEKLKEGTYRPDFYLPESKEYIEVKGFWRKDSKERFEAFKEQYPNEKIQLIMKEEMNCLGLI